MPPRDEWEAERARILSEVDAKIQGLSDGLGERVKAAVKFEFAAQQAKLDSIQRTLDEDREDRNRYRIEREIADRLRAEQQSRELHNLALQKGAAEVDKSRAETGAITVTAKLAPTDSARRYRNALFATIATIVVALVGLAGVVWGSHHR